MFYNYLKIGFRNLVKNKVYSFINVGGLAMGLAACLAIGLYVQDEYSYDRFHTHFQDLYRVTETQKQADGYHPVAVTPGPLAPSLEADFAEIMHTTRVGQWSGLLLSKKTKIEAKSILITDHTFLQMFDFPLVMGNPATVFLKPDEIIINETLAEEFFGPQWREASLVGETLVLNDHDPLVIAGVVQNVPINSHLQFEALLPFEWLIKNDAWSNKWSSNSYHTYLQLKPGTDIAGFEQKIAQQIHRYDPNNESTLQLQPLSAVYLYSKFDFKTDFGKRGDIFYVRIFSAVGLIVLLIALVNFINLATARASRRAREVGVRKSVGARRQNLIAQFLSESLLMTTLAVGLALLLAEAFMPLFSELADKPLTIPFTIHKFWLGLGATTVLISLLTGLYPAFFLSAYRPAKVLKGIFNEGSGHTLRKTLVVGQFMLSVALGIGTIVIYRQLHFIQNKNLGFDQSQLLYFRLKGDARGKSAIFKDEVLKLPGVASVTATTSNLVDVSNSTTIEWEGQAPKDEFLITQMNVDADFLQVTGMQVAAGRNFSAAITSDTLNNFGHYLINETAAKRMGYTSESALGKKVKFWGLDGEVIGVLKDFHFQPLSKTIEPFVFRYRPRDFYFNMLVKTRPNDLPGTINAIEKAYRSIDPNNPISYGFVDQDLEKQYRTEQRTGLTVFYFSLLAVLISCLGLFGLATFNAETRTKEIGIRKVLGASILGITGLLARDFLKLVLIAIVIASPPAYYFLQKWLADFAYRIDIQWWMFAAAGCTAVVIATLTVGFQSLKTALVNPVKSLRSE